MRFRERLQNAIRFFARQLEVRRAPDTSVAAATSIPDPKVVQVNPHVYVNTNEIRVIS